MKPPHVALDTNLHVAHLLSPKGNSAASRCILKLEQQEWQGVLSTATYLEHEDVLRRAEFGFDADLVTAYLDALADLIEWHTPLPSPIRLKDHGDQKWLDLLHGSKAEALVTYNQRDFVEAKRAGYGLLTPAVAIKSLA